MRKTKWNIITIALLLVVIIGLTIDNLRLRYSNEQQQTHLRFHETADSVSIGAQYIRYACGECFPNYFQVQEVMYSDSGDTLKYLNREIMVQFESEQDEAKATAYDTIRPRLILRGQMLENNYQMLKIKASEVIRLPQK